MEEAEKLGKRMVDEGLVACVNLLECRSIYTWQGVVEDTSEVLMAAKTTGELQGAVKKFISENHPYDTPEIITLNIDDVNEGYLQWVLSSTGRS